MNKKKTKNYFLKKPLKKNKILNKMKMIIFKRNKNFKIKYFKMKKTLKIINYKKQLIIL
jgi:hypothetical protein